MNKKRLLEFIEKRSKGLQDHYVSAQDKYEAIWALYANQMPTCITNCKQETGLDGPQGIYWIGAKPKVLFAGREHYGWHGESKWETNRDSICYAPLEFAYFTVASMGSYWSVIKELISEVLKIGIDDWDNVLENIALTNACKCLAENSGNQWFLHQQCKSQNFLYHEILTVGAPMNVLFTRTHNIAEEVFQGQGIILEKGDEFFVQRVGTQIIIECAHPGRQSLDWRATLKETMSRYLPSAG